MSVKNQKDLIYLNPEKFRRLVENSDYSIRHLVKEFYFDKRTIISHLNGSHGCKRKTFLEYKKIFGWRKMFNVVKSGVHIVEMLYKEETKKEISKNLFASTGHITYIITKSHYVPMKNQSLKDISF